MSGEMDMTLTGDAELAAAFEKAKIKAPQLCLMAVYVGAEKIMTQSKKDTPVFTGALRASGQVEQPVEDGPVVTVDLGYGNNAAPYALYVHERLDVHHPVGKAKFLEDAMIAGAPDSELLIGRAIAQAFGE